MKKELRELYFHWHSIADALQKATLDRQEDYKLKNLVEAFDLAGNLIGA